MIEFYPNRITGAAPFATFKIDRRMTIEEWLMSQSPSYERRDVAPISIALNDELIEPRLWQRVKFKPSDHVQIWYEPKGTDPFSMAFAMFKGVQAVGKWLMPKMPGTPSNIGTQQGDPINEASAKGNKVKLGELIRNVAGFQKVFPSYLAEPRPYFTAPREQWVEMLLYVSAGDVSCPLSRMKVGETPLISLGADSVVRLYAPGEDVSGDSASMLWFNVGEVGASSSGSAGLELTIATSITPSATAAAYQFNGDSISIPAGAGSFPADWQAGMTMRVLAPYQYTVVDGGAGRDIVEGPLEMLAPTPGMLIEVAGNNAGNYVVNSYTPYSPATPAGPGTASTLLASSVPSRYDFDVSPLTFSVSLGATSYPITLNTSTTDIDGLVSAFNIAKGSAPFTASASGGLLLLTEISPFSGMPITSAESVLFGSAPVGTTGTPPTSGSPEVPAQMTLDYDGGSPVVGLAVGTGLSTIGPRGLRYRITAFNTAIMTVERLTSAGSVDGTFPGFNPMETVNAAIAIDSSSLQGGYRGPFNCSPEAEKVIAIEYNVLFTRGLIGVGSKDGFEYAVSSSHQFEYRDADLAGPWTAIQRTVSGASKDAQGFTFRVDLPYPMNPECQMKRMPKIGGKHANEVFDDITWTGLRGLRENRPASYPGMTVMSVKIRGGDRLSSQSESQISVEATRKLPVRVGGVWQEPQTTRGIVPWCLHVLKSLGYEDSDIDLAEFDRLDAVFTAAGQLYDETIDDSSTAKDRLNDALACGWSELTISNGLVSLVRDEPRAAFDIEYGPKTQTYSPQNMTNKPLTINGPMDSSNEFDGVDVEYYSSITWAWETIPCRWPGDNGDKVEKVRLPGVSDRDRAYRFGMRRRGHQKFRQDIYTWETVMAGNNSGYLSFCAVTGNVPGTCQSAQIIGAAAVPGGFVVTATEPLDWTEAGPYQIGFSRPDGSLSGPYPATQVDEYRVMIADLDFVPDTSYEINLPQILFGPVSNWAYPVLVTKSDPSNGNVSMKGMPYDARVYTYDNATAP